MPVKIPWEIIGPVAAAVVIILIIVFAFILKFKKLDKPNSPSLPKPSDTLSKKTLCFNHESRIASNETAVKMMCNQAEKQQEQNREDHKQMFEKMDDMKTEIIGVFNRKNKSRS